MEMWINYLSVFLAKFNSILDMYAPLKKIFKQKLNFRNKPWITLVLQKSISIKNHLLIKYIKLKDATLKTDTQIKWKGIKKLISLKELSNIALSNVFDNGQSLTELQDIADAFNKYFVNVVTDIQLCNRYSKNNFHNIIPPINIYCYTCHACLLERLKIKVF